MSMIVCDSEKLKIYPAQKRERGYFQKRNNNTILEQFKTLALAPYLNISK